MRSRAESPIGETAGVAISVSDLMGGLNYFSDGRGELAKFELISRGVEVVPELAARVVGLERLGKLLAIEAHLTIVFAALAVSRWIEHQTGWSIRKFVKTARRYRTVEIQAGPHTITAASPLPDDLRQAINAINASQPAHQY